MDIAKEHNLCYEQPTAASYIQNDLVVLFDAIENAGFGISDNNSLSVKNLVGNEIMPVTALNDGIFWRFSNSYTASGTQYDLTIAQTDVVTFEFVSRDKFMSEARSAGWRYIISCNDDYKQHPAFS